MGIFKKEPQCEPPGELEELKAAVLKAKMPEDAESVALKEIELLLKTNPGAAEYTIGLNYIDYLVSLPWNSFSKDNLDIRKAEQILDKAHYGLREVKDRILEHLAVRSLKLSRKPRVLVVDDEKVTRSNLEHVLTRQGYHVSTASNGTEALALVERSPFDVVITDLKMNGVDGMQILDSVKLKAPSTEVIIITGYATVPSAIEAMKKGSYHYLAKPFKLEDIKSTVKKALSNKKTPLNLKGPVICFVGPPGTGKTSLGMSIARSLGRKFIRFSLGGMKDEAEIRGHRRSYVGALPGRIIQEIRRAGIRNPVIMLDEIDKIGQDFKGDPASALLEVLDPEQNSRFKDHYLDVPFDLSSVFFIATANTMDPVPRPLLDRLEVIVLSGYTEAEKERIAFDHLIPKVIEEQGLCDHQPEFSAEAIQMIIRDYTRESGLRSLQRQIETICRKRAREILTHDPGPDFRQITPEDVRKCLGPRKHHFEAAEARHRIGVTAGLAWTETGGEIVFVEATKMKGKNRLILTGSLGDVMKESAQAALSYIRSHPRLLDLPEDFYEGLDIHIHVPAGAIPKDGPSAGLTIAAALISLLSGRPARNDLALTGELTLSGRILPVGGIKEKLLAARRGGMKHVVLPAKNGPEIEGLPDDIRQDLDIIMISELSELNAIALL